MRTIHQSSTLETLTGRRHRLILVSLLLLAFAAGSLSASEAKVTVMTRNIYLGGDIGRPLRATTAAEFFAAVAETFAEVQSTNFPERAVKLTDEIEKRKPLLIGLQEVAMWRSQFPADFSRTPNATAIEYDFLELLLAELTRRDLHYSPVVIGTRADVEVPALSAGGLKDYRLTMRDVILVRDDANDLQWSNPAERNFITNASIPTLAGPIVFKRGWGSVDVTYRGESFRFINTHLEAFAEGIRVAQVTELLAGPANTQLSVIIVGDFNSEPGSPPYNQLATSGFLDAGADEEEGFTCCHASNLRNETSTLSVRIDHVWYRGLVSSEDDVRRVGYRPKRDRTVSGLWPSDHAGVIAKLILGQMQNED